MFKQFRILIALLLLAVILAQLFGRPSLHPATPVPAPQQNVSYEDMTDCLQAYLRMDGAIGLKRVKACHQPAFVECVRQKTDLQGNMTVENMIKCNPLQRD